MVIGISGTAHAAETSLFFVGLNYTNGSLSLSEVYVASGNLTGAPDGVTEYTYRVLDSDGDVLYSSGFDGPSGVIYHDSQTEPVSTEVYFTAPYFSKAASMDIYDAAGSRILSVDTSGYQQAVNEDALDEVTAPYEIYYVVLGISAVVIFALYMLFFHNRKGDAFSDLAKKWS